MTRLRGRWRLLTLALLLQANIAMATASNCDLWPSWKTYRTHLLDSGRVVDAESERKITTSEGQSYGLFFALVANDRERFEQILEWTENNLAQGDLTRHLPAWLWGHRDDDSWGVMDANPAADADLWIAYTLTQAGRLWKERRYRVLSQLLARQILHEESVTIPGLGLSLLPAPSGFQIAPGAWRLNPSYVPIQLLRGLAATEFDSAWSQMIEPAVGLIKGAAPAGFAADWVQYEAGKGFKSDAASQAVGSYNAIRVYLWAGMLDAAEPQRQGLLMQLQPMAQTVVQQTAPPEFVDTQSGRVKGTGPAGFSAALIPFLMASGESHAAQQQTLRVTSHPATPTAYYNQSLSLFGVGWQDGFFKFNKDGALTPRWKQACARSFRH